MDMNCDTPRVVIVGAGIAGITMAMNLRSKLRHDNFIVSQPKHGSIGGTWRGCGSDVPGHWYSLSTEPNPYWKNYYITQPEIRAYWEEIYRKHDLASRRVFNTCVKLVEWDEANGKMVTQIQAEAVIQAVGYFTKPVYPNIPGNDKFRSGPVWHSSQWRHDVDLKGMTVGVIGNGCSATQFVPAIAAEPTTRVINFCRTPQWIAPKSNYQHPNWVKWAFAHVPFLMYAYRSFMMITLLTWYIRSTAPAKYRDSLIPTYPPGCKRIVLDSNYLAALHQPNIDLNWTGIQEIVEDGIVLKTGESTGFYLAERDVVFRGIGGRTLNHYFESEGGYYGTVFPGFPNLFTIVGPNSASAHASLIFVIETQVSYILKLMTPIINGKAKSLQVTQKATTFYNTWIQKRMASTIFLSCFSYYRGDNRTGAKNLATFPGMVSLYWESLVLASSVLTEVCTLNVCPPPAAEAVEGLGGLVLALYTVYFSSS
ncbi:uncharacterized protein EDB93DRAFT_1238066 [Suillus bovinus]|uniref:uncharacterized protein n=1 Tax=Suillus bovinus TaxID=48563 RepID=UPI001B873876|nr:uncharacterized protein EDB93DRAFT_1238066 [Suillus bovinus]KAG2158300.1 hypothetical protein EDB93DRAFT_1238066 [Suillus bovinus]